jgi:hypothetical protein
MSLPFILLLASLVFAIAAAGIRKAEVIASVRNDAWSRRAAARQSNALSLGSAVEEGSISETTSRTVSLPGWIHSGQMAESRNTLVAGDWADPAIRFRSTSQFVPHHEPLQRIQQSLRLGSGAGVNALSQFLAEMVNIGRLAGTVAGAADVVVQVAGAILRPFGFEELYRATQRE